MAGDELERSYEVHVRDRLKFRVGSIVYVAFSLDESEMESCLNPGLQQNQDVH